MMSRCPGSRALSLREFFIDNLLVRIHCIIVMIGWTGLAPWETDLAVVLSEHLVRLQDLAVPGLVRLQRPRDPQLDRPGLRGSGSYLRLVDSCITQLKAQGPSRTCNGSKEGVAHATPSLIAPACVVARRARI